MDRETIFELISKYKLEDALNILLEALPNDIDVIALNARLIKIRKDYFIYYILKDSEYNIEINRIIIGILEIAKTILGTIDNSEQGKTNEEPKIEALVTGKFIHPLHRFPRGPRVPHESIPFDIILNYAELINYRNTDDIINTAINLRRAADKDEQVTTIKLIDLLPNETTPPIDYWTRAFRLSCLHGPRMVGALLFALPDDQFTKEGKEERRKLIAFLESMWNQ